MNISELLAKYDSILNNTETSPDNLLKLSEDLQNLSFICHTFYSQKLQQLSTFTDITTCLNEGQKHLSSISTISAHNLILKQEEKTIQISLLPPKQLVAIFNDNFSEDDLKFCEIYFSYLDFFIALNIGIFFTKQA